MMKNLLPFWLILLTLNAYTQKKTTVYHYKKLKASEGAMLKDQKEGLWYYWTRTGVLAKTMTYTQGIPDGAFVYYDTSRLVFSPKKWEDPTTYKACLDTQYHSTVGGKIIKTGFYQLGKKTGTWKEYHPHRDLLLYEINYANDAYHGESKEYWSTNGNLKKTTLFTNGLPNGHSKEYNLNGTLKMEGDYENGLETGAWTEMRNADKYIRHYEKGKLNGRSDHYNAQDSLVESYHYKNGLKNGPYFEAKGNGVQKTSGEYLDNKEHGWFRYYYNGQLEVEEFMRNGKHDGPYTRYNKGVLTEKGFYKKGQKDSTWTTINMNGHYRCETVYMRGNLESEVCYDSRGQKTESTMLSIKNAQLVKTVTRWYNSQQKKEEIVFYPGKKVVRSWNEKGKLIQDKTIDLNGEEGEIDKK